MCIINNCNLKIKLPQIKYEYYTTIKDSQHAFQSWSVSIAKARIIVRSEKRKNSVCVRVCVCARASVCHYARDSDDEMFLFLETGAPSHGSSFNRNAK